MKGKERKRRQAIVDACLAMNASGINQGTSGNISTRWKGGLLITPSGLAYDQMGPEDMVFMTLGGDCEAGRLPSSEWRFHRDILAARDDVEAVVHTHSLYATVLAIRGMGIPALHYMIAAAGGANIACAPYATFGSQALSDHAVRALQGRHCCLLANHGVIATGPSLERALWLAGEVETLAKQYVFTLLLGGPQLLDVAEIDQVAAKFKTYGQASGKQSPLQRKDKSAKR